MALQPTPSLQSGHPGAQRLRFATKEAGELILGDRQLFTKDAKQRLMVVWQLAECLAMRTLPVRHRALAARKACDISGAVSTGRALSFTLLKKASNRFAGTCHKRPATRTKSSALSKTPADELLVL
jgi:hypothetical protein